MIVLRHINQLATCPPEFDQNDAGLINDAALVAENSHIVWVGADADLSPEFSQLEAVACRQKLVIPGLIDCHTHLCFGGWRGDEFDLRLQGKSYQEIAAAGGGIRSTVAATRNTSDVDLRDKALLALRGMLDLGVTTVECKSGYGLERNAELKQLEVYRQLDTMQPVDLIPTFLGAHMVPEEFNDNREAYIRLLCDELIPEIGRQGLAEFCDAFVEQGAFTIPEGRQILQSATQAGLKLKLHADQLSDGGGAALAAELIAVSAEHLEYASQAGIDAMAAAGTVAVSLPLASLYLRERYMAARTMLNAGVKVAVATDFNPGSAPSYHLPLAMLLACINQQMTPQEALTGATTVAARAVARSHLVGSVLPGYLADIAIIDSPTLNHWLYHFRANACCGVIKSGDWQRRIV